MARTRTPGIRTDRNGGRIIDKEHRGIGIYMRLGLTSQEQAEKRLCEEIANVDAQFRLTQTVAELSRIARHATSHSR